MLIYNLPPNTRQKAHLAIIFAASRRNKKGKDGDEWRHRESLRDVSFAWIICYVSYEDGLEQPLVGDWTEPTQKWNMFGSITSKFSLRCSSFFPDNPSIWTSFTCFLSLENNFLRRIGTLSSELESKNMFSDYTNSTQLLNMTICWMNCPLCS